MPVLSTRAVEGHLDYPEGLNIGYRAWLRAGSSACPFGHGLGYTMWRDNGSRRASGGARQGGRQRHVRVRNTERRQGTEVVQVSLSRPGDRADRSLGGCV